jgi:hypothetical protein
VSGKYIRLYLICILIVETSVSLAQNSFSPNPGDIDSEFQLNTITTAVPFLLIAPDARGGAIGDAGVSSSPDINSIHWNPSKLAFMESEGGFALTYSPWLRNLVGDIDLSYVAGYKKLDRISTIGASLRYFSLGKITQTDDQGNVQGDLNPNEFAIDVVYAMRLSDNFSFGLAARYIRSDLTNGQFVQGVDTRAGNSAAADVSGFYTNDQVQIGDYDATFRAGINISNLGAKMSYSNNDEDDFLPTNLRLGPSLTLELDDYNEITFIVEANKLLVPSPPKYRTDSTGTIVRDADGDPLVLAGRDPDVSVASGVFGSFSDAPGLVEGFDANGNAIIQDGSVHREEFNEINYSLGMEYWYDQQFAVRLGYFYEHPTKGNRQYLTVGLGLKLSVFGLDVAYLVGNAQQNPLANTVRFTLKFDFDSFKEQNQSE